MDVYRNKLSRFWAMGEGGPFELCLTVDAMYLMYPWYKFQGARVQLFCLAENDAFVDQMQL
jgi:hypothetical protein